MADTVTAVVITPTNNQQTRVYVRMTCVSDGTGENAVLKFNPANFKSAAPGQTAAACQSFNIEEIRWCMQGFSSVKLTYDASPTPVTIAVLNNNGADDFGTAPIMNTIPETQRPGGILWPGATAVGAGTGGIKLTSVGASATATYDITMKLYLVPAVGNQGN